MKRTIFIILLISTIFNPLQAQLEPAAGKWKTWFIPSGQTYRLTSPAPYKSEIAQVIQHQQKLDADGRQHILYWNAGAPGFRWQDMMNKLWMSDTSYNGVLANMLLGVATYDAIVTAWDTKYTFHRPRPYQADQRIKVYIPKPESPAYPCEHSVAAGVAATIIAHFYPRLADSVCRMAQRAMASRIAAGVSYPSDTKAGFDLGKRIAEKEIEHTKNFTPKTAWDGKRPEGPGLWKGQPMYPLAGLSKTVVLDSSSQLRPGPPPDFAKEMEELKKFKPNFRSTANAFYFASQSEDLLTKKIFEYNIHLNPPRAARMYAITAVAFYDCFISCWDAKYTYWATRPDQYDTTFRPVLYFTPPFPGYPSGHAMMGGVIAEVNSYFFPAESELFVKRGKDGAESRFQGGIHFRSDNETGFDMGRKLGELIIRKAKTDGADTEMGSGTQNKSDPKSIVQKKT
ncbi:MAG: phosphatase PAP2 family protein [Saprospiraceae bacterium]|nr:phosphatase PAP2 family protein [Saprospiraceae bacterium]